MRLPAHKSAAVVLSDEDLAALSVSTNVKNVVRDASEVYPNPAIWDQAATVVAPGDFIAQAGNTAGAGWVEISKSPFDAGNCTTLEMVQRYNIPVRIANGISMSQRAAGQHIGSAEFVSTDDWVGAVPIPDPVPVEIYDATQATTTITINFSTAPAVPFRIGQRVNVYGFVDNRLNVSSATISATPTTVQIQIVGNGYTFTSTTITSTLGSGAAFVERVDVLGGARNGVAILRENATATNASFYSRSEGSLARPSGTLAGSHGTTIGSDAATVLVSAPYAQAFAPANKSRLDMSRDGYAFSDRASNGGNGVFTTRYRHDEVVPNLARPYKQRYRLRSSKAPCRPIAEIVTAVKTASSTATFTTRAPHGLVTGQWIGHFGVANQTAFAAQASGVQVTVTGTNTFTAVTGANTTATSYGGFVFMCEGQQALPGAVVQAVVNAARTSNVVVLTGSASWSGPLVGETVEVYGVTNVVDGANLGLDGTYRVEAVATTSLTLSLAGSNVGGADVVSVAAGGGVIRRTTMRIHYSVAEDYEPQLIEAAQAGIAEAGFGLPVNVVTSSLVTSDITRIAGTLVVNGGLAGTLAIGGAAAHSATTTTNPMTCGGRVVPTTIATTDLTLVAGDAAHVPITPGNQQVVIPFAASEVQWSGINAFVPTAWASASTPTVIRPASGTASVRTYMTGYSLSSDALGAATTAWILDGAVAVTSVTIANPGVFTNSGVNDFKVGDAVIFGALGTITGISVNTVYYVTATSLANTTFTLSATVGGTALQITGSTSAVTAYRVLHQIRLQTAALTVEPAMLQSPIRTAPNVALSIMTNSTTTGNVYLSSQGYYGA